MLLDRKDELTSSWLGLFAMWRWTLGRSRSHFLRRLIRCSWPWDWSQRLYSPCTTIWKMWTASGLHKTKTLTLFGCSQAQTNWMSSDAGGGVDMDVKGMFNTVFFLFNLRSYRGVSGGLSEATNSYEIGWSQNRVNVPNEALLCWLSYR